MEYFVIYDVETGNVLIRGSGPEGTADQQIIDEGHALMIVPRAALMTGEVDIDVVRNALTARIDAEAELFRQQFITPGAGQAMTYQRKEAEARAWIAAGAPNPVDYPFLAAEAAATGESINQVAANVVSAANLWAQIGSAIEAVRLGAKKQLAMAAGFPALAAASAVDWSVAMSGGQ